MLSTTLSSNEAVVVGGLEYPVQSFVTTAGKKAVVENPHSAVSLCAHEHHSHLLNEYSHTSITKCPSLHFGPGLVVSFEGLCMAEFPLPSPPPSSLVSLVACRDHRTSSGDTLFHVLPAAGGEPSTKQNPLELFEHLVSLVAFRGKVMMLHDSHRTFWATPVTVPGVTLKVGKHASCSAVVTWEHSEIRVTVGTVQVTIRSKDVVKLNVGLNSTSLWLRQPPRVFEAESRLTCDESGMLCDPLLRALINPRMIISREATSCTEAVHSIPPLLMVLEGVCFPLKDCPIRFSSPLLEHQVAAPWTVSSDVTTVEDGVTQVFVTPTSLVQLVGGSQRAPSIHDCRVARKLGSESFVKVSLRDDDGSDMQTPSDHVRNRWAAFLKRALITTSRKKFQFVYSSVEGTPVYFCSKQHDDFLDSIVPGLSREPLSVVKQLKVSRLGFSETKATGVFVTVVETKECVAQDGTLLADGCGTVAPSVATDIWAALQGRKASTGIVPCAFQIRCGPCKGMIVVDPTLEDSSLVIRMPPSAFKMKTFDRSASFEVEVAGVPLVDVQPSLSLMHLLLLRENGVPRDAILALARRSYERVTATFATHLHSATDDVFAVRRRWNKKMTEWAHTLPLAKGDAVSLTGVVDPTVECVVEPGTVFIHRCTLLAAALQLPDGTPIESLLLRHPCYQSTDVLPVKVVSTPCAGLDHLRDVVVFPRVGPTSMPSRLAGGDLDGDQFVVLWSSDVVKHAKMHATPWDTPARIVKPLSTGHVMHRHVGLTAPEYAATVFYAKHSLKQLSRYLLAYVDRDTYAAADSEASRKRDRVIELLLQEVDAVASGTFVTAEDVAALKPVVFPGYMVNDRASTWLPTPKHFSIAQQIRGLPVLRFPTSFFDVSSASFDVCVDDRHQLQATSHEANEAAIVAAGGYDPSFAQFFEIVVRRLLWGPRTANPHDRARGRQIVAGTTLKELSITWQRHDQYHGDFEDHKGDSDQFVFAVRHPNPAKYLADLDAALVGVLQAQTIAAMRPPPCDDEDLNSAQIFLNFKIGFHVFRQQRDVGKQRALRLDSTLLTLQHIEQVVNQGRREFHASAQSVGVVAPKSMVLSSVPASPKQWSTAPRPNSATKGIRDAPAPVKNWLWPLSETPYVSVQHASQLAHLAQAYADKFVVFSVSKGVSGVELLSVRSFNQTTYHAPHPLHPSLQELADVVREHDVNTGRTTELATQLGLFTIDEYPECIATSQTTLPSSLPAVRWELKQDFLLSNAIQRSVNVDKWKVAFDRSVCRATVRCGEHVCVEFDVAVHQHPRTQAVLKPRLQVRGVLSCGVVAPAAAMLAQMPAVRRHVVEFCFSTPFDWSS